MEISLQKTTNYQTTNLLRKRMIREEKLHIEDSIDYEKFQYLYKKYAPELEEREFAKYFLDIDFSAWYKLQSKERKNAVILKREYYIDEEFDEIENIMKEDCNLYSISSINYDTLTFLWNTYGDRFSLKMFAEEIFGLSDKRVDDLNSNRNSSASINIDRKNLEFTRCEIRELREKIIEDYNLHIESTLTLEEFNKIYNECNLYGLDEVTFGTKIFKIRQDTCRRFIKGKRPKIIIFSSYPVSSTSIIELREKVILLEKLKMKKINPDEFWKLYDKYGGILTSSLFAEEILDTTLDLVRASKRKKHEISILGKIEITDENIENLRNKVIFKFNLKYHQLMTIREMRVIYNSMQSEDLSYYIMSERDFIIKILGVPSYNYNQLDGGLTYESYILTDRADIDFIAIRKKVISENNLHYDDTIGYKKFHKLHQKYAKTVREHVFASKVLDICQQSLDNLRQCKYNVHILLDEPLPTLKELIKLKEEVVNKYKIHRGDKLDYKKFKRMYNKYGGVMPEDMFSEYILDVSHTSLLKIKRGEMQNTTLLIKTFMSPEEIENLRKQILLENNLVPGSEISVKNFNKLYNKYNHTLPKLFFARRVLGMIEVTKQILDDEESNIVLKIPIKKSSISRELLEDDIELLKQYLIEDVKLNEIAITLDVPPSWITKKCDELYEKNIISFDEVKHKKILRLYSLGNSPAKISQKLNIDVEDVKKLINESLENR